MTYKKVSELLNKQDDQKGGSDATPTSGLDQAGDPGRTPGKAEGSEADVEESLRQQESKEQK